MNTQENEMQEKKNLKKYSIHQKINTRMLGIEIFNQNIAVPYSAYLICKLIYKEDIHSFKEMEELIFEIQGAWENEQQEIFIKKIHIFTSEKHVLLTISLGFFQKDQAKKLPDLKEWFKNKIENHTKELSQRRALESDLLKKLSTQIEQLETKIDKLENRVKKSETVAVDANKKVQEEIEQMNQMLTTKLAKKNELLETGRKNAVDKKNKNQVNVDLSTQINAHKHEKQESKFHLVRGKKVKKVTTQWQAISPSLKEMQVNTSSEVEKIQQKIHLSEYEKKIVYYFTEVKTSEKKQIIPKKKFLEWQAKIEYIDYLWKMFESEKQSELVIAEKLSCKNLIKELPIILVAVEELSKSTRLFNYWIYCPQATLIKLKGYVVLAEYLASIADNTETVFMVS
ncbi:hypothetical protein ACYSNW_08840 [Enterococcus sp. LJL99]